MSCAQSYIISIKEISFTFEEGGAGGGRMIAGGARVVAGGGRVVAGGGEVGWGTMLGRHD
jgi:hypothetical protein